VSKVFPIPFGPDAATSSPVDATFTLLRKAGIVLAGSALLAVCAHIALPLYFTPVPLTLQTFAVLFLGLVLSPQMAAATLCAYLAEGALGMPVFALGPLGSGGFAHLIGPTGGYLLAYPVAATLTSYLWRRMSSNTGRGFTGATISAAVGSLPILALGAAWLAVLTHASAQSILTVAVLPFLPGDALKVVSAAALAVGLVRLRRRIG
jgi:biotin transport system substrate-specific component